MFDKYKVQTLLNLKSHLLKPYKLHFGICFAQYRTAQLPIFFFKTFLHFILKRGD